MTKENFDKIIKEYDELLARREDLAGRFNGLMDGDPDCENEDEFKLGNTLDYIESQIEKIRRSLGVPRQFLDEILDSCVTNRWELCSSIVLRRRA